MKAFDLDLYNQNVKEGKTPKLVTRSGQSVRLVCVDRNSDPFTMVGLVDKIWRESVTTYTKEGYFEDQPGSDLDLFFADTEPTYRPYKNKEEVMKAIIHNCGWVKEKATGVCESIQEVRKNRDGQLIVEAGTFAIDMETLLKMYTWYMSDDPCGVKEE